MGGERMLGVFAHPDDEVFCAGGTLARYAAEGVETMVVSATRGQAGQIRDAAVATRRTLGEARERELKSACEVLGVRHVRLLDYFDGTLREVGVDALAAEVATVLDEFRPDVVVTFGDDGAYGHPDHVAISRATAAAFLDRFGDAGPQRLYHSHFPRSRLMLVDRLSDWLMNMEEGFRGGVDFARALSLFAEESATMRLAGDHAETTWAPPGFCLVEQGEPATSLYLILSGKVDVVTEHPDGTTEHLRSLGPGEFFGELGVATGAVRSASVVANEPTTCFVLSPGARALFEGRGTDAVLVSGLDGADGDEMTTTATTVVEVAEYVDKKIAAVAAHRSQYPIEPEMFPRSMLADMFGREYFVRVVPPLPLETSLLP